MSAVVVAAAGVIASATPATAEEPVMHQVTYSVFTEQPFRGAQPIFLGDDLTDEHGFFAARQLGGYGILVGPERKTTATYRMEGVEAALTWLEAAE